MRARFASVVQLLVCGASVPSPPRPPADLQGNAAWMELGSGSGSGPPSPLQPPPSPLPPPSLPLPQMPVVVAFKASGTAQKFQNATVIGGIKATMANVVSGIVSGYASSNPHLRQPDPPVLTLRSRVRRRTQVLLALSCSNPTATCSASLQPPRLCCRVTRTWGRGLRPVRGARYPRTARDLGLDRPSKSSASRCAALVSVSPSSPSPRHLLTTTRASCLRTPPHSAQMVIHIPNGASTSAVFGAVYDMCDLGSQTFGFAISDCVVLVGAPPNAPPSVLDNDGSPSSAPPLSAGAAGIVDRAAVAARIAMIVACCVIGSMLGITACCVCNCRHKAAEKKGQQQAAGGVEPSSFGGAASMQAQEVRVEMQQPAMQQQQEDAFGVITGSAFGGAACTQAQETRVEIADTTDNDMPEEDGTALEEPGAEIDNWEAELEIADATEAEAEAAQARASAEEREAQAVGRQRAEGLKALAQAQEPPQSAQSNRSLSSEGHESTSTGGARRRRRERTPESGTGSSSSHRHRRPPGERHHRRPSQSGTPEAATPEPRRRRRESSAQSEVSSQPGSSGSRHKRSSKPA